MKSKTTIIFDFDGTIANSLDFTVNFLVKEGKKFGYKLDKKEVKKMIREESLISIIRKYKLSKIHVLYIVWKIRKDFQKISENVKMFPEIKKLLLDLEKKYNLILLTSNDKLHVESFFKKHKILHCFNELYFKSSLFGKKRRLKKIIRKHKLNKDEVVYIGDELRDFESCQKSGVDCISVSYGFNSRKLLETKNKLVVDSVKELRKVLLK